MGDLCRVLVRVHRGGATHGLASRIGDERRKGICACRTRSACGRDDRPGVAVGSFDEKAMAEWKETREPYLLESSVPGVFVAGDVRHGSVKRVASAVGEGSIAVQFVHQYLAGF